MSEIINGTDTGSRQQIPRLGQNNRYTLLGGTGGSIVAAGGAVLDWALIKDGSGNFYNAGVDTTQIVNRYESTVMVSIPFRLEYAAPASGRFRVEVTHQPSGLVIAGADDMMALNSVWAFSIAFGFFLAEGDYLQLAAFNDTDQDAGWSAGLLITTLT